MRKVEGGDDEELFKELLEVAIEGIDFSLPEEDIHFGNVLNVKYPRITHPREYCFKTPCYGLLSSRIREFKTKVIVNLKAEEKDNETVIL